jgi:hypothetical protein
MDDDDFRPRLGKIRSQGSVKGKRYTHQLLAAINRAEGRSKRMSGFSGKRLGRGGTMAATLSTRDCFSAYRQRRVIVKARIVKLAGKGMATARAHLRYVQRDGVTREGDRG